MDFEDAKENIQPLAAGRNASILHASLCVESPQELLAQRRELEQAIHDYTGDDALEPWYAYISWIEQSFPSGGKESGLEEVLTKCLSRFENEERYFQDRRMIKLYMKFIDSHQHPMECYQQLFNAGIGTMVADFYICWAYHYDLCGNTRKADEIFRRGIACRAQPLEELQEAHQHFGFTVAQRLMYQDDDHVKENTKRQFEERRLALTSLRGHRRKATVGSIRTGAAVKNLTPGTIQIGTGSLKKGNTRVQVFSDENAATNLSTATALKVEADGVVEVLTEEGKSVVRSIIDSARNQENFKEPGPWNKAHDKKKSGKLFSKSARNTDLGFNIHEDVEMDIEDDETFKKPLNLNTNTQLIFKYPKNFKSRSLPQKEWLTPVTIENETDPRAFPQYKKTFMYPRPNVEFQPEEYRAYCWFRGRGITNGFTEKRDPYWKSHDINMGLRLYPNFAKQSKPQKFNHLDAYCELEKKKGMVVCFSKLYDTTAKVEYQIEEVMANFLRRHDTILMDADMDETACDVSERMQRRKSFFPSRRSMMPRRTMTTVSAIPERTGAQAASGFTSSAEFDQHKCASNNREVSDSVVKDTPKEASESIGTNVKPIKGALPFEIFEDTTSNTPIPDVKAIKDSRHRDEIVTKTTDLNSELGMPNTNANPIKSAIIPFEIYEDTTKTITTIARAVAEEGNSNLAFQGVECATADEENAAFQFKTPALPSTTTAALKTAVAKATNKLGFEIYTEPCTIEGPSIPLVGTCEGAVGGAAPIFDPEETCSTQIFNIFLKSQSVSTPIAPQKVAQRQFGSVLKVIPNPPELLSSPEPVPIVATHTEDQENIENLESVAKQQSEYSPLMVKQLSTILETSEHGTTQGTHTTGGTKSSTNSTSDGEGEREAPTRLLIHHTELEPLEEQSRESSTMPGEIIASMENINLQGTTETANKDVVKITKELCQNELPSITTTTTATTAAPPTPAQSRLELVANVPQISVEPPPQNFSIYEDERNTETLKTKPVGNFSRLYERDDTTVGLAIRSVRFQEDKTDTISKILTHTRSIVKFQEDKTETLPTTPIAEPALAQAQYDYADVNMMPKLPKESSLLLTMKNANENLDDSFEFFCQSPPGKSLLHPRYDVSAFNECMQSRTPLMSAPKRHCDVTTPNMMHLKPQSRSTQKQLNSDVKNLEGPALFEDEIDNGITAKKSNSSYLPQKNVDIQNPIAASSVPLAHRLIPRDSFLPEFSLVEETQPHTHPQSNEIGSTKKQNFSISNPPIETEHALLHESAKNRSEEERNNEMLQEQQAKSNLGDSYFKNFSEIMDSQPQADNKWHRTAATVQVDGSGEQISAIGNINNNSFLKDFSMVMESQSTTDSGKKEWRRQQSLTKGNNKAAATTPAAGEMVNRLLDMKEERENVGTDAKKPNFILGNSYLKDFSMVMESQPLHSEQDWRQTASKKQEQLEGKEIVEENRKNEVGKCLFKDSSGAAIPIKPSSEEKSSLRTAPPAIKLNASQTNNDSKLRTSCIMDLSFVPDSQPTDNSKHWQQSSHQRVSNVTKANPQLQLNESYLKEFSLPVEVSPLPPPDKGATTTIVNNQCTTASTSIGAATAQAPQLTTATTKTPAKPLLFLDSFMEDFSGFQQTGSKKKNTTTSAHLTFCNDSKIKLGDSNSASLKHFSSGVSNNEIQDVKRSSTTQNSLKLHFLDQPRQSNAVAYPPPPPPLTNRYSGSEKSFELNSETAMFSTNISMIKNSTLLAPLPMPPSATITNESVNILQVPTPIKEQSLHIKVEDVSDVRIQTEVYGDMQRLSVNVPDLCRSNDLQRDSKITQNFRAELTPAKPKTKTETEQVKQRDVFKTPSMPIKKQLPTTPKAPNFLMQSNKLVHETSSANTPNGAVPKTPIIPTKMAVHESRIPQRLSCLKPPTTQQASASDVAIHPAAVVENVSADDDPDVDSDAEMSIYFKHTPKTPKIQQHVWHESSPSPKTPSKNVYVHREVDLNATNQIIDNIHVDPQVNPFNGDLQTAFLEQIEFSNYIEALPNCMMVGHVSRLHAGTRVEINDVLFDVTKLVGEGAYGAVFCGVESKSGKKFALKQERPPNFWEYYICLEVHSRLNSDDLVCAFMSIDYALVGNNASIIISPFSVHGSLIAVCNKVKKHTLRNVDEYVVMLLTCELLSIIDHLHAVNIIHADIKADNFILMKKLEYPCTQYALQLIDFGVSIDMKLFKPNQTFNYVHNENAFKCVEMRERRPWTYQLDLYGLAGVIHVLLFGKFMDIAQRPNGTWMHKTHVPRYINRTLWDKIFQTLLNIRNCETMPNLQNLRALIKEEIAEKEKFVLRKVSEFNSALSA